MAGFQAFAAVSGAVGIVAGSVGAHGLAGKDESKIKIWNTASNYQLLNSVALLAVPRVASPGRGVTIAGGLFTVGITLFSGSCYAYGAWCVRVHID